MSSFELGVHLGELMLNSIELHTSVFSLLFDFTNLFFLLSKLKVDSFVLVGQLLRQSILKTGHERMVCWQVTDISSVIEVLIDIILLSFLWA